MCFVVCIVGKMAQDVGWCENIVMSFLSTLVGFGRFHPYISLFCLVVFVLRVMVREQRSGKEG